MLSRLAYPANSIRQIPSVWDKIQFLIMGQKLTLNEIEHGILRGQSKDLAEKYGRFYEPRIHVALVCAAMGCPPLRNEPFLGRKLGQQLDDQALRFLSNSEKFRINRDACEVYLSSIFKWFGDDFVKSHAPKEGFGNHSEAERAVLNFASKYLQPDQADFLPSGKYTLEYLDYDWSLNDRK